MDASVAELPGPMELLDLEHQNSITLSLTSYQQGETTIHPKNPGPRQVRIYMQQNGLTEPPTSGTPISIRIPVLRVFGFRVDKPSPARYWDISSLTLQADLLPRLIASSGGTLNVTISANGYKPTKRYSVEVG